MQKTEISRETRRNITTITWKIFNIQTNLIIQILQIHYDVDSRVYTVVALVQSQKVPDLHSSMQIYAYLSPAIIQCKQLEGDEQLNTLKCKNKSNHDKGFHVVNRNTHWGHISSWTVMDIGIYQHHISSCIQALIWDKVI